ncbi:hypothetical protein P389DRAFT_193866 [Cystobasidium minutum MCA 4210]|uniref:uncharacterized protein n=1 Tax=Cystobasidium minutum MCA 4210 TaxID=1397322 RepID=UPI0034CD87D4|eukprot:jgi/Rhomi1/193866/gm1.2080_g
MPRHSVRNSISRPFLPIKHALVRPKTERGISSDSPSIQLARALLESALKDADDDIKASSGAQAESDDCEHGYRLELEHGCTSSQRDDDDDASGNTGAKQKLPSKHSHSRQSKSLDLSTMTISRPSRLQRASSSSCDVSCSFPCRDGKLSVRKINDEADRCAAKSCPANGNASILERKEGSKGGTLMMRQPRDNQETEITRPRSKSVSVLSHTSTIPSKLLCTISETSEEFPSVTMSSHQADSPLISPTASINRRANPDMTSGTSGLKLDNTNRGIPPPSNFLKDGQSTGKAGHTAASIVSPHTSKTTPAVQDDKVHGLSIGRTSLAGSSSGDHAPGAKEEEEGWEVLSLRKRRKSSKYQPPAPSLVKTLLGSPNSQLCKADPIKIVQRHVTSPAPPSKQPRHRRTSSFKALTSHLARPLPRYRRASANDAVDQKNGTARLTAVTQSHLNVKDFLIEEVLRSSPSTNLDVWSEHLRKVIEHIPANTASEHDSAADDSGFAPSLHDQSIGSGNAVGSPPRQQQTSEESLADTELPRIPTVTLVSPMGTLRRYISCPDGILSSSPTKKHRPLPALPEQHQMSTTIVPTCEEFSPALPPLKSFVPVLPTSPRVESDGHEQYSMPTSPGSRGRNKRSVRRKSVVNNLRSIGQPGSISELAAGHMHSKTPTEVTTTTLSNLDSFKTARSSTSNLWPPPEELFASLFSSSTSPTVQQSQCFRTGTSSTKKRVLFSPSIRSTPLLDTAKAATRLSESASYVYDPNAPNARTPLQLLPRDLNTDLQVKPWMVVMPRFVLDDLAVGVRDWDKDRLEVVQQARHKSRQRSI